MSQKLPEEMILAILDRSFPDIIYDFKFNSIDILKTLKTNNAPYNRYLVSFGTLNAFTANIDLNRGRDIYLKTAIHCNNFKNASWILMCCSSFHKTTYDSVLEKLVMSGKEKLAQAVLNHRLDWKYNHVVGLWRSTRYPMELRFREICGAVVTLKRNGEDILGAEWVEDRYDAPPSPDLYELLR